MSGAPQDTLPETFEIPTEWFLSKLPQLSREDQRACNRIIFNQIRASMKILGENPEPQGLNLTARSRAEAEIETERKLAAEAQERLERAEAELETVRNLAVEAQKRLECVRERWNLEYDRSIYANAEKGRKIGGLCALMDKIKEVMPEDVWTRRVSDDAEMKPASSRST